MSRESHVFAAMLLVFLAAFSASPESRGSELNPTETQKNELEALEEASQQPKREASRGRATSAVAKTGRARVLFITKKECTRCDRELSRLRKSGGDFEAMQARGWRIGEGDDNHIQIVDRDEIPEIVQLLKASEFPTVACVVDDEIVRSFKDGCTTPLDAWTFGWLIKGQNERPAGAISEAARVETTGNYRLRGNHWTLEGDPNPSKQSVLNHLRGPNHGHAAPAYGAIENWSLEELRSLHDDLHEREGGTYGVAGQYQQAAAANRSLDAFSGNRKVMGK